MLSSMRWSSEAVLDRVDLAPLVALLPHLVDEWAELAFGSDGRPLHGRTGVPLVSPDISARLLRGPHRAPGATYEVRTVVRPEPLASGTVPDPIETTYGLTTVRDDRDRVEAVVVCEEQGLEGRVGLGFGVTPSAVGAARWDLDRAFRADDAGCFAIVMTGLVGRRADAAGTLDLRPLLGAGGSGGTPVLTAEATLTIGAAEVEVTVVPSLTTWTVRIDVRIRARGRGRLLFPFVRTRIRTSLDDQAEEAWAGARAAIGQLRSDLARLPDEIATAGGPRAFVHDELWGDRGSAAGG